MRIFLPLLLAACGTGLTGLGDTDFDTEDHNDGPVQITDVTPWWGPTVGGNLVTVTGIGFTGNVTVDIGGTPAQAFRESDTSLLVTIPPASSEGPVELAVHAQDGDASLSDGYWYSNSGMPDIDGDSDTDTGTNPTGMTGGLVELTLLQVACPSCFGYADGLVVAGAAAFHQPTAQSWTDWLPAQGTCGLNVAATNPSVSAIDVGEWVYLESGSTSLPLRRTSGALGTIYESSNLNESSFLRNASYDVNVPEGGSMGSFEVDGGMETTEGFDSIQPVEMLYVYPEAAFAAAIPQSGAFLSWSPYGGVGKFLVQIDVYSYDGTQYLGNVTCFGADNGSMVVPGTLLSQFPAYSLAAIGMYRYRVTETVMPNNGATLQAISQFGVLGTGTIAPW